MVYKSIRLEASSKSSLNTELRYIVASARVEGIELLEIKPALFEDEKIIRKAYVSTLRALADLKHDGVIKIYVASSKINDGTIESEFLINKYSDYVVGCSEAAIFVMI